MISDILLLPGDGIGPEIVSQAKKILLSVIDVFALDINLNTDLVGGAAIEKHGVPLKDDTLAKARDATAILLGAVGGQEKWDKLPLDQRPEKGLLELRSQLNLFANLRPATLFPQLASASSLKNEIISGLDIMIVRELTGGIYFGQPRGIKVGLNGTRTAFNTLIYSEEEIRRIAKVAFTTAQSRKKKLCSIDKANVLESSVLWREVVSNMAKDYPDVEVSHMYIDNAVMQLISNPRQFDVIVSSNMFGDILSDGAAQLVGSIGMLPSASLNEQNQGMYEPIHGSAPDIAGKNIANPIATILSVAMMMRYTFKNQHAATAIETAIEKVIDANYRTQDIYKSGQKLLSTTQMGDKINEQLLQIIT